VPAEVIYKQDCSKCHGADGSCETSLGRILNAPDFTDGVWWAKHPRGEPSTSRAAKERACVWEKVNQGADSQSRRLRSKIQAIVTISSEVERSLIFAGAERDSLNNLIGTAINIRLLAERLTATIRFSV